MAHIQLPGDLPGMHALLTYRPEIAPPLLRLMQVLMRSESELSPGMRELVATAVSIENHCEACSSIHGSIASCLMGKESTWADSVLKDPSALSESDQAVIELATETARGNYEAVEERIDQLRHLGYSDTTIHDIVLISALFNFYNKYIDGLGVTSRDTPASLMERASHIADNGYQVKKQ